MFSFNTDRKEILIYDVIGEDWFGGGVTAVQIEEALSQMDGGRVTARINSVGGIADEGIAIYNSLRRYEGGVDTVVDALAASAASIIAMAGENRTTNIGGRWMIHRAMGVGFGNAEDMVKLANVLEIYDDSLADIYTARMTDHSKEDVLSLMSEETWFTAEQSVELGLATTLSEETTEETAQQAAWFEHPPTDLDTTKPTARLKPHYAKREIARLRLRLSEV